MRLTIQLKLQPTPVQANSLRRTLVRANEACDYISQIAWEAQTFRQFAVHKLCYAAMKQVRYRHRRLRQKLQRKRTHGSRRRLNKLAGQEYRFATWVNHTLSKRIVAKAEGTKRAIALEDLTHIRTRVTARRSQRATLHSWAFAQLRAFLTYKAQLRGVPIHVVDPRNTSRTCPSCGGIDKANRKTQASFVCTRCGFAGPADVIAAGTIASRAAVSPPYHPAADSSVDEGKAHEL